MKNKPDSPFSEFAAAKEDYQKLPLTSEYAEATQEKVNKARLEFIDKLEDGDKENFLYVESIVAEIERRKLPFLLMINPFGYKINDQKGATFWNYQKFHGDTEIHTKEFKEMSAKMLPILYHNTFRAMSEWCPWATLKLVDDLDGQFSFSTKSGKFVEN